VVHTVELKERVMQAEQDLSLAGGGKHGAVNEEEEEEESVFKADAVNEEDSERDRATQV
jgi:hypothetical protein